MFLHLFDVLNKRGQDDTVSVAAGDTLVWLKLPGVSASDFSGGAEIMDAGYAEGGAAVRLLDEQRSADFLGCVPEAAA